MWMSPEKMAQNLTRYYHSVGVDVTYEHVLERLLEQCKQERIPIISIPPHMEAQAELN